MCRFQPLQLCNTPVVSAKHSYVCHCSKETVARNEHRQAAEQFHYSCLPASPPVFPHPPLSPLLLSNTCVSAVSKQLSHQAFLLSSPLSSFPSIPLPVLFSRQALSLSLPLCLYPVPLSLSPSSNREGTACCSKQSRLH